MNTTLLYVYISFIKKNLKTSLLYTRWANIKIKICLWISTNQIKYQHSNYEHSWGKYNFIVEY